MTKHFELREKLHVTTYGFTYTTRGYFFKHEWMFDLQVKPHFITRLPLIDPELDSKEKLARNHIDQIGGWGKVDHLLRGSTGRKRWHDRPPVQELRAGKLDKAMLQRKANGILQSFVIEDAHKHILEERYGGYEEPYTNPNYQFK